MRKQNVLTLTTSKIEELSLKESLFGDFGPSVTEVFVTRNQLMETARRIHKSLDIEEEYEICEERFKTEFVDGLLTIASGSLFEEIDIETDLDKLSRFAIDIKEDLKPDVIYKHLNSVFTVNKTDGTEHIVLKNDQDSKHKSDREAKFDFGIKSLVNFFFKSNREKSFKTSSVNDQLRTLNTYEGLSGSGRAQ